MRRFQTHVLAIAMLSVFGTSALSQETPKPLARADVEALMPNAHIATRDELLQLMPGARLKIVFSDTSHAAWTNGQDGKLEQVRWDSSPNWALQNHAAGAGSWRISEDGRYCGLVGWKAYGSPVLVEWCRFLIKTSEDAYILKSVVGYPDWTVRLSK